MFQSLVAGGELRYFVGFRFLRAGLGIQGVHGYGEAVIGQQKTIQKQGIDGKNGIRLFRQEAVEEMIILEVRLEKGYPAVEGRVDQQEAGGQEHDQESSEKFWAFHAMNELPTKIKNLAACRPF